MCAQTTDPTEIKAGLESDKFFDNLNNIISKPMEVGVCVLDRKSGELGANGGSQATALAQYFNELNSAGFTDAGTASSLQREVNKVQLPDCKASTNPISMGGLKLPRK